MKLLLLPLAALSGAFIFPNEQISELRHVEVESSGPAKPAFDSSPLASKFLKDFRATFEHVSEEIEETFQQVSEEIEGKYEKYSETLFDDAVDSAEHIGFEAKSGLKTAYAQGRSWADSKVAQFEDMDLDVPNILGHHGHHGHHGGHHHHHKPNQTVYELISNYKYTSELTKLINKYDDLVEILNGTAANYTVFAPLNSAFKKLPKHVKPSKKFLKSVLTYHVSPEFYPAGRILFSTRTIPTLLKSAQLGKKPLPQRLSTRIGLKGVYINYLTNVEAFDIFGTNGVIHGVNNVILPPPNAMEIVNLLPGELSTLQLGLLKTGLFDTLNTTDHQGGTLFAPDNSAFAKLGPKINGFLFSEYGLKYLKALLKYHVAPQNTLYSDEFYKASSGETTSIPKGQFHADLPTLLEDRSLSIDIARYGRLIEIKINSFGRVAVSDFVAEDGVIHTLSNVLIPPKKLSNGEMDFWTYATDLTEEDLKERLGPFVEDNSYSEEL